jgi:hypothetical protein
LLWVNFGESHIFLLADLCPSACCSPYCLPPPVFRPTFRAEKSVDQLGQTIRSRPIASIAMVALSVMGVAAKQAVRLEPAERQAVPPEQAAL